MAFDGEAFGHRLKSARIWAKVGAQQLAQSLGVSDEVIYQLERGERKTAPKKSELEAMAKELGQSREWLLDGDDPPWVTYEPSPALNQEALARMGETMADTIQQLGHLVGRMEQLPALRQPPPDDRKAGSAL